jgi:hypothetical protein
MPPSPEAPTSPPTIIGSTPMAVASAGDKHGSSKNVFDAQAQDAAAAQHDDGPRRSEAHSTNAVVANCPPAPAIVGPASIPVTPVLVDPLLILAAQALDDLESTRIANENRLRSLRDVYGLAGSSQEAEAAGLVEGLAKLEHQAELSLKRALRRHPLGPWVKRTVGVGEKQGARLLSAIGDPYWNSLHDRPRTVSELWAYCGYHVIRTGQTNHDSQRAFVGAEQSPGGGDHPQVADDTQPVVAGVAPARARGQKANWSAEAKSRAWLIACSCIKQAESPYRPVYDDGRAKYADALHPVDCRRCGPSRHPAPAGSPLSAGHQHARALRLVSKTILRDLWIEARSVHEESSR